jgi:hypothetical protein
MISAGWSTLAIFTFLPCADPGGLSGNGTDNTMNVFEFLAEVSSLLMDVIDLLGHGCHGVLQPGQGFAFGCGQ